MTAKRIFLGLIGAGAVVLASAALAAPASAPAHASILIRHQLRGCHSWSVDGGKFAPSQKVTLGRGGTITFTDHDLMPHKLIKLSGPAVLMTNKGAMKHMGAQTRVTFPSAGTYRFTTKAGEDYVKGVKTIGEDNVLKLTVKVI